MKILISTGTSVWIVDPVRDNVVVPLGYLLSMADEMRRTKFLRSLGSGVRGPVIGVLGCLNHVLEERHLQLN